ncbi:MAG: ADP-ribosylation factor-like protein [archaeon]|nr:ADP-ribosylation factor-like protein [archaeon]
MSSTSGQLFQDKGSLDFTNTISLLGRPEKRRKILLLGGAGIGKTAFLMRYKQETFIEYYEPTIHSIIKHTYELNNDLIEIEFIDRDGLTEFSVLSQNEFAFGVSGYILIYSTTDRESFDLIENIFNKIQSIANPNVPKLLIGTKNDLIEERKVSWEEGVELAKKLGCLNYECSAKTGYHIEKAIKVILAEVNKYEDKFDIKTISCLTLIKFFMRRNYLRKIYYCLSVICIICCIYFFGYAFRFYENCTWDVLVIGGLIFNGCWQILFTIFGMIGISQQKADYLNHNLISNLFSLLYDVALMFYRIKFEPQCNPTIKDQIRWLNYLLIGIIISDIVALCTILFFGYFYYVIFKKELYSYII